MILERTEVCFLNILRCALKGIRLEPGPGLTPEEWETVFHMAGSHRVLPLVFETVHALPELEGSPLLPPLKRTVFQQVMVQTRKTADLLSLLQTLASAGLHPLVVKGILCRELYPLPDHRSSSDEDLLIAPEEFPLYHQIFAQAGLHTTLQGADLTTTYEIPYRQENGPLYIELHRHLFPPESESYGDLNQFFRDARKRAVCETISGAEVHTLEYTDHLFYLICHAFKHFLHSGFGIRQVCDIVLFASAHGKRIDWDQIERNCRQIRAFLFAAAIFRIGRNYLDFDPHLAGMPASWQNAPVDEAPMLMDLLQSGVYGSSSRSRQHSSSITLDAVAAQKQGRAARNGMLVSLFPPADKLKNRYPYLKERPWLLPAAWASRIGGYCMESLLHQESNASQSLEIGKQRLDLLKQYGILDPDQQSGRKS